MAKIKKYMLQLLISVGLCCACNNTNPTSGAVLYGNIDGIKQGKLYLERILDSVPAIVDSVIFDGNSRFSFNIPIESPEMVFLYLEKTEGAIIDDFLAIFMEPLPVEVSTTLKNFELEAQVKGSENHDKYVEYRKLMKRFQDKKLDLIKESYEAEMKNDVEKILELNRKNQTLVQSRYMAAVNFAIQNNDKEIAPYLALYEIFDINTHYLDSIYNSLTPTIKSSKYGIQLKEYLMERKSIQ